MRSREASAGMPGGRVGRGRGRAVWARLGLGRRHRDQHAEATRAQIVAAQRKPGLSNRTGVMRSYALRSVRSGRIKYDAI